MRAGLSVAALTAAVLVSTLPSQRPRQGGGQRAGRGAWAYLAKTYDKNGDGRITLEEFGRGERGFRNLDRDGDGVITAADRRARGGRRRRPGGAVGQGARFGALRQFFDLYASFLNVDGEAGISAADWSRYLDGLKASEDGVVSPRQLGAFLGASANRGMGRMASGRVVRLLDANRDGEVRLDELRDVVEVLDKNQDGRVDADDGVPVPPAVGMEAPDFTLKRVDSDASVTLSSFVGKRPVALIFGSYT